MIWLRTHNHFLLGVAWTIFLPLALLTSLKDSLPLVVAISIYANIASEFAAHQAKRAKDVAERHEQAALEREIEE